MNIQNFRDIIAQINAAHPTEDSLIVLLEGQNGWLKVTFVSEEGIKIQLRHECIHGDDWVAIAPFSHLSDIAWYLSKHHPDDALIAIMSDDDKLRILCEEEADHLGSTLAWLRTLDPEAWCFTEDDDLWTAQQLLAAIEHLLFDDEEFEAHYECLIAGVHWHHVQSAALIARQNTDSNKTKYPALCGINISAVNNDIELSAMCPTATTHHLIWNEDPFWENFSFTIPVELIDTINQSVDASAIHYVRFLVSPELIQVQIKYGKRVVCNGIAMETDTTHFLVEPLKGRYWYPKIPVNQVTEKSVIVNKQLLQEALTSAIKTVGYYSNEIILQVQDEQLFVHGRANSFQIDAADCDKVEDNEIRVCAIQLLDMLKYIPDNVSLLLHFPDKITQAVTIGTFCGIQYLLFGLVKRDRVLSTDVDISQKLLTIPGIMPGEPDTVVELVEQPLLDPPLPEEVVRDLRDELKQSYGQIRGWQYTILVDEMCDQLIEARKIIEEIPRSPELFPLFESIKEMIEEYGHEIALYEVGGEYEPNDLKIEEVEDVISSVTLLAGRVKEVSLKVEKTYSVRMTFA